MLRFIRAVTRAPRAAGSENSFIFLTRFAKWLKGDRVDTITGKVRFDGPYNYGDDFSKVKQEQDGHWFVVFPTLHAAPGRKVLAP